jgi:hypothetical protein
MENSFFSPSRPSPHFWPTATSRPGPARVRACSPTRAAVQWTGRTPHAVPRSCALANPHVRLAAWPRRTGGHGRCLAGWSEPLHRDRNASRVAPDRALAPAPAPFLLSRLSFSNAAPLLVTARPLPQSLSSPAPPCLRSERRKLPRELRLVITHL